MPDLDARAALSGTRFTDVLWVAEVDSTNRLAAELARAVRSDRRLEAELRRPLAIAQLRQDLLAELQEP